MNKYLHYALNIGEFAVKFELGVLLVNLGLYTLDVPANFPAWRSIGGILLIWLAIIVFDRASHSSFSITPRKPVPDTDKLLRVAARRWAKNSETPKSQKL